MDEIRALRELMTTQFELLRDDVGEVKTLQRETNGRLRAVEHDVAGMKPRVLTLEREMGEARRAKRAAVPTAASDTGQERVVRAWHVAAAIAIIVGTIAVVEFIRVLR